MIKRILGVLISILIIISIQYFIETINGKKPDFWFMLTLSGGSMILPIALLLILHSLLAQWLNIEKKLILKFALYFVLSFTLLLVYIVFDTLIFDYNYDGKVSYLLNEIKILFALDSYFFVTSIIIVFLVNFILDNFSGGRS
jgi:hypothetical protein